MRLNLPRQWINHVELSPSFMLLLPYTSSPPPPPPVPLSYDPVYPKHPALRRHVLPPHAQSYAFAHLEVWAHVVLRKLPFALVFEDDATNRAEASRDWKARMDEVRRAWSGCALVFEDDATCR